MITALHVTEQGVRRTIDPDEALRVVLESTQRHAPQPVTMRETVGLRLAQDVRATGNHPPFDRAMMDGYAVRTADAASTACIVGEVSAGRQPADVVAEGACVEVMTGACCPPGTQAVVPKEHARRAGNRVVLPGEVRPGWNITAEGSECCTGTIVWRKGNRITPLAVAVMASVGADTPLVIPRPRLALITTGAELTPCDAEPPLFHIRDANGPMLLAMARVLGIDRPRCLHASDQREAILGALERAASDQVIVLTGGVSAGKYDFVPHALQKYGAGIIFHGVAQKPGKPLLFARKGTQLIFGLPGHPLGAHLGFHRYVTAAIYKLAGEPTQSVPLRGYLHCAVKGAGTRTYFLLARATREERTEVGWALQPCSFASSADVFGSFQANCYVRLPPRAAEWPTGHLAEFQWIAIAPWTI